MQNPGDRLSDNIAAEVAKGGHQETVLGKSFVFEMQNSTHIKKQVLFPIEIGKIVEHNRITKVHTHRNSYESMLFSFSCLIL